METTEKWSEEMIQRRLAWDQKMRKDNPTPRGPATVMTPDRIDRLCDVIAAGNYTKVACQIIGIAESTFHIWKSRGKKHQKEGKDSVYRDFWIAIQKAEAEREAAWVRSIDQDPSWQSKAWLLERRHPERWRKREHVEHSGEVTNRNEQHIHVTEELVGDADFLKALQDAVNQKTSGKNERMPAMTADEADPEDWDE
jgi:hypothetical protein